MSATAIETDFTVADHGSIYLLTPLTQAAKDWCEENIGEHQSWAGAIVVKHRFITDLILGMQGDGLIGEGF